MLRASFTLVAALGLARLSDCGVDEPPSGRNAPCTRARDCQTGLACADGVCVDLDAGVGEASAPPSDGAAGDADGDGG